MNIFPWFVSIAWATRIGSSLHYADSASFQQAAAESSYRSRRQPHDRPGEQLLEAAAAAEKSRSKRSVDPAALQAVVEGLSQQLSELKAEFAALKSQQTATAAKLEKAETTVAFHAYHSTDPFNVAAHGTILYDQTDTNIGGAYDTQTGFFTAPVTGTYAFFVTCMAEEIPSEEIALTVNGQGVASCYSARTNSGDPFEQSSTSSIQHLQAGQRAVVKTIYDGPRHIRGNRWNSFTGFLLRAD